MEVCPGPRGHRARVRTGRLRARVGPKALDCLLAMTVWVSRGHCGLTGLRSALEAACGQERSGRRTKESPTGDGAGRGRPGVAGAASVGSSHRQWAGVCVQPVRWRFVARARAPRPHRVCPAAACDLAGRTHTTLTWSMLAGVPGRQARGHRGGSQERLPVLRAWSPRRGTLLQGGVGLREHAGAARAAAGRVCVRLSHGGLRTGLAPLALGARRSLAEKWVIRRGRSRLLRGLHEPGRRALVGGSLVTDGVGAAQRGPCVPVQRWLWTVLPDARHAVPCPRPGTQWGASTPPFSSSATGVSPGPPPGRGSAPQFRALRPSPVPLAPTSHSGSPVSLTLPARAFPGTLQSSALRGPGLLLPLPPTPASWLSFPKVAEAGRGSPGYTATSLWPQPSCHDHPGGASCGPP